MLEEELLKLCSLPLAFVQDALIMNGTSSALDGNVSAEVEVELKGVSAASLNESPRDWIAIAIALLGEEADVMTLASDDDREVGNLSRNISTKVKQNEGYGTYLLSTKAAEALLHIADFLVENCSVLALGDTIADVKDTLRSIAAS